MVINIPVKNILARDRNPRSIQREDFEKLCLSLEKDPEFLSMRPILVYEEEGKFIAYAGNQRLRAAKKLKYKEIPCIVTPYDEKMIKERTIRDNVSSGDWDWDTLSSDYELAELLDLGLDESDVQIEKEDKLKPPQLKIIIKFDDADELEAHRIFFENYCEKENLTMDIK